jgi:long-chain acyl-CoA synthetase
MYADRRHSVSEFLVDAHRWPDRTYLVSGNRRLTYAEHEAAVDRVAARLLEAGVRPGERVVFLAGNQIEWVVAFWAVLRIGAVVVAANAWWSKVETRQRVEDIEPTLILTDSAREDMLPESAARLVLDEVRPDVEGTAPPTEAQLGTPPDEDDPAMIVFTSGTTGPPKGTVLSHRSMVANQHNILLTRDRRPPTLRLDSRSSISLLAIPLFHIGGLQLVLTCLLNGGTLVFTEGRFDPAEVRRLIERERVTIWNCVPTMLQRLLDHPELGSHDLTSIRSLTTLRSPGHLGPRGKGTRGHSGCPARGRHRLREHGVRRGDDRRRPGRSRDDARIRGPGNAGGRPPHRSGEGDGLGEILVRSPTVMSGYWNRPDDDSIDADGWLHTGDLGRIDEQGRLFILDRAKDIIIRGGENIASSHVEQCLRRHPAVEDVAVCRIPTSARRWRPS